MAGQLAEHVADLIGTFRRRAEIAEESQPVGRVEFEALRLGLDQLQHPREVDVRFLTELDATALFSGFDDEK